jgi:hypothetical protein
MRGPHRYWFRFRSICLSVVPRIAPNVRLIVPHVIHANKPRPNRTTFMPGNSRLGVTAASVCLQRFTVSMFPRMDKSDRTQPLEIQLVDVHRRDRLSPLGTLAAKIKVALWMTQRLVEHSKCFLILWNRFAQRIVDVIDVGISDP